MSATVFPPTAASASHHTRLCFPEDGQTVEIHDPYAWLRERENPAVLEYLKAENAHTAAVMADTKQLQETLFGEMVGRIEETDSTAPVRDGDFWYYSRTEKGKDYRIHCRKQGSLEAAEQVILDGNVLAAGHEYFDLGVLCVSPDHRLLAYAVDTTGAEKYLLRIRDLSTGEDLPEAIEETYSSAEWSADGTVLFYLRLDDTLRPFQLWRHRLSSDPGEDVLVFQEDDRAFHVDIDKTRSERFLLLESASLTTTETRVLDAATPEGEFRVFLPRSRDVEYSLEHQGKHFWILINDEGRNFRLCRCPLDVPWGDRTHWEQIVGHRKEVCLEGVDGFAEFVVLSMRDRGLEQIVILDADGAENHAIAFPEAVYTAGLGSNPVYRSETIRLSYESPVMPRMDVDYDVRTRERRVVKQKRIRGDYDASRYRVERLHAEAPDGVLVPMSVVYRADTPKDGSAPALLYGYGAYGLSTDPGFSSDRISLLDRGFVFGIAHVRGGGDLGETWHDAGKMHLKTNTFSDFIACAELLIAEGFTEPRRLGILGRSAGGLLVGAVVNMRPELFGAAVASVPFVDVLNTMLDEDLPLTVGEFEEWGNPKQRDAFERIQGYSPYENIREAAYPAMLLTAGLNDPRVSYWEPAKFVARLRTVNRSDRPLLLKTELGAGHFGPSGRYESWKETAFEYAFLLTQLGNQQRQAPSK